MHLQPTQVEFYDSHGHYHKKSVPIHHIPNYGFARQSGADHMTIHWFSLVYIHHQLTLDALVEDLHKRNSSTGLTGFYYQVSRKVCLPAACSISQPPTIKLTTIAERNLLRHGPLLALRRDNKICNTKYPQSILVQFNRPFGSVSRSQATKSLEMHFQSLSVKASSFKDGRHHVGRLQLTNFGVGWIIFFTSICWTNTPLILMSALRLFQLLTLPSCGVVISLNISLVASMHVRKMILKLPRISIQWASFEISATQRYKFQSHLAFGNWGSLTYNISLLLRKPFAAGNTYPFSNENLSSLSLNSHVAKCYSMLARP
ncbi:hypothetical protein GGI35DRAFT_314603 [Trichoderma velutinum]